MITRKFVERCLTIMDDIMDGGDRVPQRLTWPVASLRDRPDYPQEWYESLRAGKCPRCGAAVYGEMVIAQGGKDTHLKCYSCRRCYFPPVVPDKNPRKMETINYRYPFREFKCALCGEHVAKVCSPLKKYCSTDCYDEALRIASRRNNRKKGNYIRYLGKEGE